MPSGTVKQIVSDAFEVEPDRRDAFVSQACGQDQVLLAEVLSLLAASDKAGDAGFLNINPFAKNLSGRADLLEAGYLGVTVAAAIGEAPGDRVGPYKRSNRRFGHLVSGSSS